MHVITKIAKRTLLNLFKKLQRNLFPYLIELFCIKLISAFAGETVW